MNLTYSHKIASNTGFILCECMPGCKKLEEDGAPLQDDSAKISHLITLENLHDPAQTSVGKVTEFFKF
jgi:hypothetical protein